jgi:vacuolar-type H+-ATPase subunit H
VAKNVQLIVEGQMERDSIIKEARERAEQILEKAKEDAKTESSGFFRKPTR